MFRVGLQNFCSDISFKTKSSMCRTNFICERAAAGDPAVLSNTEIVQGRHLDPDDAAGTCAVLR